MSDPTKPGSEPDHEPEIALDAEPETNSDAAEDAVEDAADSATAAHANTANAPEESAHPDEDLDADSDETQTLEGAVADADTAAAGDPPGTGQPRNRQLIFIAAALVVALAIGGGLFFVFRGDDKKSTNPEDQAEAAALATLSATYKVAAGDASACEDLQKNLFVPADQAAGFADRCREAAESAGNTPLVINSINTLSVNLDDAAGSGEVEVEVDATVDGKAEKQTTKIPVTKVEGVWKVNLATS